jgi:uncharacterized membrane protein YgdD (TMEM256/DUF423 family)
MTPRILVVLGALLAGLAVAVGAFGAHALRARLSPEYLTVFETAARYQMYHALALIAVGLIADRWPSPLLGLAGWLFLAGIVLFSGSLYALTLTGVPGLGAITPLGGVAFLAGWTLLVLAVRRGANP